MGTSDLQGSQNRLQNLDTLAHLVMRLPAGPTIVEREKRPVAARNWESNSGRPSNAVPALPSQSATSLDKPGGRWLAARAGRRGVLHRLAFLNQGTESLQTDH